MNTTNQPFWKDENDNIYSASAEKISIFRYIRAILYFAFIVGMSIWAVGIISKPLMWVMIIFWASITIFILYFIFRRKSSLSSAGEIQKLAREKLNTSYVGSAIHVAGHPLLQREQPIVLALVSDSLNIYSYEDSTPLDTIHLKNIQGIFTVSYDDDHVPHIDSIDSVAQALQLTFLWREQPCTCLFRRMRKMKSIDWFHAIQQTRLQLGLAK